MADLQALIRDVANRYSLPADLLLAQAKAESSLNPNAVGPITRSGVDPLTGQPFRAYGLFQFMPATFVGLGFPISKIMDPSINAEAAGKYMRQLWSSVKQIAPWLSSTDAYRFALVAYNGGLSYVSKAIKAAGSNSSFDSILTALKSTGIRFEDVKNYFEKIAGGSTPNPVPKINPGGSWPAEYTALMPYTGKPSTASSSGLGLGLAGGMGLLAAALGLLVAWALVYKEKQ